MFLCLVLFLFKKKEKKPVSLAKPTDQQDILYSSSLIKICNQ